MKAYDYIVLVRFKGRSRSLMLTSLVNLDEADWENHLGRNVALQVSLWHIA